MSDSPFTEEIFDMNDINSLLNAENTMHDEKMTNIYITGNELLIEYGLIGENDLYAPYKKLTVKYTIDNNQGIYLKFIRPTKRGSVSEDNLLTSEITDRLSKWDKWLHSYSVDTFGRMVLYFNASKGRKSRSCELCFTPEKIVYRWE